MRSIFRQFLLASLGAFCGLSLAIPHLAKAALSKRQALAQLRELQGSQLNKLRAIDQLVNKKMQDSRKIRLRSQDPQAFTGRLETYAKDLDGLARYREEYELRRDFVDRLIFQIDSKYSGQPLKEFLEMRLLEMSMREMRSTQPNQGLMKFMSYLSIAIREFPERQENLISFVEGYMEFSTIRHPKQPQEFLQTRNYTNGVESTAGNPKNREEIGDASEAFQHLQGSKKAKVE